MAIDPIAAAVEAIAATLEATLAPGTLSAVLRGWPESDTALDLSGLPVLSVTPGTPVREACAPTHLGSTTTDGVTTFTYRVGWLRFTAQLDLWAAYKVELDDAAVAIENACIQAPPLPPEVRITSTGYYSRPLTCTLGAGRDDFDGDSANKGEWRRTWDLEVSTDVIRQTTHVLAVRADIAGDVGDDDDTSITETVSVS